MFKIDFIGLNFIVNRAKKYINKNQPMGKKKRKL